MTKTLTKKQMEIIRQSLIRRAELKQFLLYGFLLMTLPLVFVFAVYDVIIKYGRDLENEIRELRK